MFEWPHQSREQLYNARKNLAGRVEGDHGEALREVIIGTSFECCIPVLEATVTRRFTDGQGHIPGMRVQGTMWPR